MEKLKVNDDEGLDESMDDLNDAFNEFDKQVKIMKKTGDKYGTTK